MALYVLFVSPGALVGPLVPPSLLSRPSVAALAWLSPHPPLLLFPWDHISGLSELGAACLAFLGLQVCTSSNTKSPIVPDKPGIRSLLRENVL